MMRRVSMFAISTILAIANPSFAADETLLSPGEYEVNMRLELPNIEDMGASKTAKICVISGDEGSHGLVVLSDNNPLGKCPVSNIRQDADAFRFDIVCPGGNAALGWAKYVLWPDRFDGTIKMKMGGKNMTMTERQTGHRIGACSNEPRS